MKKRLLSILLTACMLITLCSAALAAQPSTLNVAQGSPEAGPNTVAVLNGWLYYDSLQEAVDDAPDGAEISLYRNLNDTQIIKVEKKNLTISYGDYTIDPDVEIVSTTCTSKKVMNADGTVKEIQITYVDAPAAGIGDKLYFTLQAAVDDAQDGDTISLYRNHDDIAIIEVEEKNLTILSNGYMINPDVEIVSTTCTSEKVPGTNGAIEKIVITYNPSVPGEDDVESQLDDILGNLVDNPDPDQVKKALEDVQNMDADDLYYAIKADTEGVNVIKTLKDLEEKLNIPVEKIIGEGLDLDADQIALIGAALNSNAGADVGFSVNKPAEEEEVPEGYTNAVQYDFTLTGVVTDESGNFAVPIMIKMPVPSGIDSTKLCILHYDGNGGYEEIVPVVSVENGVSYATFVVKHFSIFVFAETAEEEPAPSYAAGIDGVFYATLQEAINHAENDAVISLYCNHDDTKTVKVEGKSLSISGGVYTINPDVVLVGDGCTKTVTGTNGVDQVIHVTYSTGGGSSSGGGGGSSSSSNKPSVSTTGDGGKVTVDSDGNVIITPDEGYEIYKILVNGKEVAIPEDGKLTGLTKDDKVVVTFTKSIDPNAPLPFTDVVAGSWYEEAVRYVYKNGMMSGTGSTAFSPNGTTTRAMIVAILHRMENEPSAAASNFTDVASNSYYANAVAWSQANGIIYGVTSTSFAPNSPITREQLATILYRYAQFKGYGVSASANLGGYSDAGQISSYAVSAMQWANAEGLILGNSPTTLNPQGQATRAEVAAILMRFCENIQ